MRLASLALLSAAAGLLVAAAGADPKTVIPARQLGMKQIGRAFKGINDQLKGGHEAAALKADSRQIATLAPKIPSWFPRGTGPNAGVKTAAKGNIWTSRRDFEAKAAALAKASSALAAAAAKNNDPATLRPLVAQVGGACKACHTTYKRQDD